MGSLTWPGGGGWDYPVIFGFEIFDSGIFWSRKIWQEIFCVGGFKQRFFLGHSKQSEDSW